ncbi:unnamed protein product [Lampetra fluviatilis]
MEVIGGGRCSPGGNPDWEAAGGGGGDTWRQLPERTEASEQRGLVSDRLSKNAAETEASAGQRTQGDLSEAIKAHKSRATEGGDRGMAESEHVPNSRATDDVSGEMAGQGIPLLDEREEGEASSEEGETSACQWEEGPKAKGTEEAAPEPTVADWVEEV